jgi:thiol-disulfide isomerase/thioredoxin
MQKPGIPSRLFTLLALSAGAIFAQPVVRPAPDLTVTEPTGAKTTIAGLKGKVVVLDFIFTTCPHCQAEGQMLARLYKEMQPKGLQVVSVAVNDNAAVLVPQYVQQFAVPYPVGYAPRETLLKYMGFSEMDLWVVPQVVVIDRKGMIRAQSPVKGDPNLQSEVYMREMLTKLLAEKSSTTSHSASPAKTPVKTASNQ